MRLKKATSKEQMQLFSWLLKLHEDQPEVKSKAKKIAIPQPILSIFIEYPYASCVLRSGMSKSLFNFHARPDAMDQLEFSSRVRSLLGFMLEIYQSDERYNSIGEERPERKPIYNHTGPDMDEAKLWVQKMQEAKAWIDPCAHGGHP